MAEKKPENCWDFWKCSKELKKCCVTHITKTGKYCWLNMRTPHAMANRGFETCFECPWHKRDL